MFKFINSFLALVFISIGLFLIYGFPYAQNFVFVASLLAFFLVYRNPLIWLYIVTAFLPIYDLGSFTGRVFLTEFDILLIFCLAALYLEKSSRKSSSYVFQGSDFFAVLIFLSSLLSLLIYYPFNISTDANSFSNYISPFNGLRIIKGTLWVLLFWPFLKHDYLNSSQKCRNYLVNGILTGVLLMGLCVLWERGVVKNIFDFNIYGVFGSLLDFSSSYRITGMFSSMHVGGTALDGYLILTFPFCMAAFLKNSSIKFRLFSFICLVLSSYAIMVSFSRGLYLGFFSSVFIMFTCYYFYGSYAISFHKNRLLLLLPLLLFILTIYMYFLFQYGGYQVMVAAILTLFGSSILAQFFRNKSYYISFIFLTLGSFLMVYFSYDGLIDSKWSQNSRLFSFVLSAFSCFFLSIMTFYIASKVTQNKQKGVLTILLLSSVFWLVVIPSASGYKMTERFSTSTADLSHRVSHWTDTLSYMDGSLTSFLFGAGLGSFPAYYFFNHLSANTAVNYAFLKDPETNFLSMSGGDYNITQKIKVKPETNYSIFLRVRADTQSHLSIKICPRHVIFSSRYTPQCVSKLFNLQPDDQWSVFESSFNSGSLGENSFSYWPIAVQFYYGKLGAKLDISDFKLFDDSGFDLIANGDYSKGSDRWYFVRDFSHDDWHTKNIFLNYFFEQGLFGIFSFLMVIAYTFIKQFDAVKSNTELSSILLASIIGVLTVGVFGTVIDNPRVTFLFLLIVYFSFVNVSQNKSIKI